MSRRTAFCIVSILAASLPSHADTPMAPGRTIISGFEPFGGRSVNASYQVANAVAAANPGRDLTLLEVPVVWGAPEKALAAEKSRPWTLWVAFGEGTPIFSIETVADNRRANYPDNERKKPTQDRVLPDAPDQLITPFPANALAAALSADGLPVRVSKEAGNYLCEEMLFNLLNAKSTAAEPTPIVLFIHTPVIGARVKMPDGSERLMDAALIDQFAKAILPCIEEALAKSKLPTPRETPRRRSSGRAEGPVSARLEQLTRIQNTIALSPIRHGSDSVVGGFNRSGGR